MTTAKAAAWAALLRYAMTVDLSQTWVAPALIARLYDVKEQEVTKHCRRLVRAGRWEADRGLFRSRGLYMVLWSVQELAPVVQAPIDARHPDDAGGYDDERPVESDRSEPIH
jgi:hypothetical protein